MSKQRRVEKLREKAKGQGLKISDDALFVVSELRSELRELRTLLLWLSGIIIGLIVGFGVAILSLL